MRHCILISVLIMFVVMVLPSCAKDEANDIIETADQLDSYDILGQWKLESRIVNGITDLSIQRRDFILFNPDAEPDDLRGAFIASGVGYETNGVFELNIFESTIHFDFGNTQKTYEYQFSENLTIFTYLDDNQEVIEDWKRVE